MLKNINWNVPISGITDNLTTSTDTVTLPLTGGDLLFIQFSGTFAGITCLVEATVDGSNWFAIPVVRNSDGFPVTGSFTPVNTSSYHAKITGAYEKARVRATAYSSGTAVVLMRTGSGAFPLLSEANTVPTLPNVAQGSATVAAGTTGADQVIVASGPGVLNRIIVTTAGTAVLGVYDHASASSGATPLYISSDTYALGTVTELNMPFTNGLVAAKVSGSAACTVGYTLY